MRREEATCIEENLISYFHTFFSSGDGILKRVIITLKHRSIRASSNLEFERDKIWKYSIFIETIGRTRNKVKGVKSVVYFSWIVETSNTTRTRCSLPFFRHGPSRLPPTKSGWRGEERRGEEAGNEAERRAKNWVNAWGVPPMITAMRLSTALKKWATPDNACPISIPVRTVTRRRLPSNPRFIERLPIISRHLPFLNEKEGLGRWEGSVRNRCIEIRGKEWLEERSKRWKRGGEIPGKKSVSNSISKLQTLSLRREFRKEVIKQRGALFPQHPFSFLFN